MDPCLDIVIPMAGLGSRFVLAGHKTQKPLIDVMGKPMYSWAADSLPLGASSRLIFITLETNPGFEELRSDILTRYAAYNPTVLTVPGVTAGQAMTVLAARDIIGGSTPLLIHNSDTAFQIAPEWIERPSRDGVDGALLVFRSNEPRWSYSREDEESRVVEVREKVVISPWASTGTYWFRRGSDFVSLADTRAKSEAREVGEYYVGPLYNDLIARGGLVRNYEIEKLLCFGTPEDLEVTLRQLAGSGSTHSHR